jgi:D-alanyl-D-alanine carboxypeptidase
MLAHDIAAALPLLREEAEARMVDACVITRAGGDEVFDPNTGDYTTPPGSTVYSGKCEVQVSDGLNAREAEAGGTELTVTRVTVKLPVNAVTGQVRDGDTVRLTSSTNDPALVDQVFRVVGLHAKTYASARRLHVERVTG